MVHYFDEIFHRHVQIGTPRSPSMPQIRRSSTTRSIAHRSDFDTTEVRDDEDESEPPTRRASRAASISDPDRLREKAEADRHLQTYIHEQLQIVRDEDNEERYEEVEEFEALAK